MEKPIRRFEEFQNATGVQWAVHIGILSWDEVKLSEGPSFRSPDLDRSIMVLVPA